MIGQTVGSYEIKSKLGEGGMGIVYAAEHTIMGRHAVVKVLRPHLSSDKTIVKRFFNEARAAASIRHPGIVDVYDVGYHEDGSAYIVMDLLEGESLAQRLNREHKLGVDTALSLVRQVLGALAAAHAQGIVHRDLKPDNIFIVRDPEIATGERAKILDFGIAKLAGESAGHGVMTQTGAVMGTPVYMSPEQCRGAGEVDHRTDLYAMGCILFQTLCGRPPFVADAPGDLMVAHLRDEPPKLRALAPSQSVELEEIVSGLLAKQPDQRFASADALIKAIDGASGGKYATGSALPPPAQPVASAAMGHAATAISDVGVASAVSHPGAVRAAAAPSVPDTTLGGAAAQVAGGTTESSAGRGGGRVAIIGGIVIAAAAAAAIAWQLADNSGDSSAPAEPGSVAESTADAGAAATAASGAGRVAPTPAIADCARPRLVLDPVLTEVGANLRRTPELKKSGNIVATVTNCTPICELSRDRKWVRVRLVDGTEGWVHRTRVAPSAAPRCGVDELPPLELAPVSRADASLSRKRNKEALARHRARDWKSAIASYKAALYADPGHLISRYNMACAYNMSGKTERGLAVLAQFAQAGCPVCLGRLVRARVDEEWASAWDDAKFVELTRGVEVVQPPLREMVVTVAAAVAAGDLAPAAVFLHPRNVVTVEVPGKKRSPRGAHGLQKVLRDNQRPISVGAIQECAKGCCDFSPAAAVVSGGLRLERICTKTDSGGVRVIRRIRLAGARRRQ